MAKASEVILGSLGLQAQAYSEIARAKRDADRRELDSIRQLGKTVGGVVEKVRKHKAQREVSALRDLFTSSVAQGKPEAFLGAAENLPTNSPEAAEAKNLLVLQSRALARENARDDIFESREERAIEAHERAGEIHKGALQDAQLRRDMFVEQLEDITYEKGQRGKRARRLEELHNLNVQIKQQELERGQLLLTDARAASQENAAQLAAQAHIRNLPPEFFQFINLDEQGRDKSGTQWRDEYEAFTALDSRTDGRINEFFDPDDPTQMRAKSLYKNYLLEQAINKHELKERRVRLNALLMDVEMLR